MNNYYNQNMIGQLMKQKDSIDAMIQQYSQPQQPQVPVQNFITTSSGVDFEAKILKEGEKPDSLFVSRRTMLLDKSNKKLFIKEVDGSISEEYEIIVPLDEKDKKIAELEEKIKELSKQAEKEKEE